MRKNHLYDLENKEKRDRKKDEIVITGVANLDQKWTPCFEDRVIKIRIDERCLGP